MMALFDPFADLRDALGEQVPYLPELIGLLITWTLVFMLVRHFSRLIEVLQVNSHHFKLDQRALVSLDRVLDVFFYSMGLFVSLLIMGVTGALYAGLTAFGVIGLIIGFAGSEVLANLLAGFVLILDRPFVIGDYIAVGGQEGTVERVSLRSCELQQGDGLYLTLPNAYLTGRPILNYTRNPARRVDLDLALLHRTEVGRALTLTSKLLADQPARLTDRPVQVLVTDLLAGAVKLTARFWVPRGEYATARSQATLALNTLFQQEHIELAVPLLKHVD